MPGLEAPRCSVRASALRRLSIGVVALLAAGSAALVTHSSTSVSAESGAPPTSPPAAESGATGVRYGQQSMDGGNWSGALVPWGSFSNVHANWTEPSVSCTHSNDLMAPWVGIDGWGSRTVQQVGVETNCAGGKPHYRGWYEMYPAPPVYFGNPVAAGDHIYAAVNRNGNRYTLTLTNLTRHWTRTAVRTAWTEHSSAEVVLESPSDAYPRFRTFSFTSATIDHRSPTSYGVFRLNASSKHGTQNHTSNVAGGHFSISYVRE